jgi:hypothetical protein
VVQRKYANHAARQIATPVRQVPLRKSKSATVLPIHRFCG